MRLWVADGDAGLMCVENGRCRRIGPGGSALCAASGRLFCADREGCACYDCRSGEMLYHTALPAGICALQPMGSMVCALSSDADSVTAFSARTGEPLFSAPAGMYPRDLSLSPDGRLLAVSGGASGQILLLDGQMRQAAAFRLPGVVCGACFMPRGLAALCAVEDGELSTRLMRVSFRGIAEEILALPLVPSCLCALPGGACAAGCHGEAVVLRANKKAALRQPVSCPVRIRPWAGGALVCDACSGAVARLGGPALYRGKSPLDALPL